MCEGGNERQREKVPDLELSDAKKSTRLQYEPTSQPMHISVK